MKFLGPMTEQVRIEYTRASVWHERFGTWEARYRGLPALAHGRWEIWRHYDGQIPDAMEWMRRRREQQFDVTYV